MVASSYFLHRWYVVTSLDSVSLSVGSETVTFMPNVCVIVQNPSVTHRIIYNWHQLCDNCCAPIIVLISYWIISTAVKTCGYRFLRVCKTPKVPTHSIWLLSLSVYCIHMGKVAEQSRQFVAEVSVGVLFMVALVTSSVHCYVDILHIIRFITSFSAMVMFKGISTLFAWAKMRLNCLLCWITYLGTVFRMKIRVS